MSYSGQTVLRDHQVWPEAPSPIRGNADAGKAKSAACVACHGIDGNSVINLYPRLNGQHEDYLHKVLADYQSG